MVHFFPHFPLHINLLALFGLTLLLGLIGGEIARRSRFLPRISGYIAAGFLVGPDGFNIVTPSLLANARIFVDISLGLILFDLGRHLDFSWLRHDRGLLAMAASESGLTFSLVFAVLSLLGLPWLPAALAATVAVATSPAVVMMVSHDLSSEGPVTRRTLVLTSLNNLFALTLFTLLLPMTQSAGSLAPMVFAHVAYRLFGSLISGFAMFTVTKGLAFLTGKRKENQFVLFVGAVVLTIGLARLLNLSSMLTLFTFGIAARNFDRKHVLTEVDFGWLARLFFVLLFVVTGVYLELKGLWQATGAVLAFLIVRGAAKTFGVWSFARTSRLTKQQAFAISLALSPMAEVAIGMSNTLTDFNPDLGRILTTIITAVVAVMHLFGPIATQFAFLSTGEGFTDQSPHGGGSQ